MDNNKLYNNLSESLHNKYLGKKINYPNMMTDFLSYRNITNDYHNGKYRDLVIYMFGLGSGTAQHFLSVSKSIYAGLVADGTLNFYKAYSLVQNKNLYDKSPIAIEEAKQEFELLSHEKDGRVKGIKAEIIYTRYLNSLPGFTCTMTKASKDKGVDMILTTPNNHRIAIQSKYGDSYKTINQNMVYEIFCGKTREKCDACIILSEAKFSSEGKKAAMDLEVDHYCIQTLIDIYENYKEF